MLAMAQGKAFQEEVRFGKAKIHNHLKRIGWTWMLNSDRVRYSISR